MLVYQPLSSRFDAIRRVDVVFYFTFDRNVRSNEPHTTMYRIVVDDGRRQTIIERILKESLRLSRKIEREENGIN